MMLAEDVQQSWKVQHWDVKQAFENVKLDVEVYMKFFHGCRERSNKVVKLEHTLCGVKQAGRQWSVFLCKTLVDKFGM